VDGLFAPDLPEDSHAASVAASRDGSGAGGPVAAGKGSALLDADGRIVAPLDLITASEVAYRAEMFPLLLTTLTKLCGCDRAGAASCVMLAARYRASCELNDFLELLSTRFTIQCLVSGGHESDLPSCVRHAVTWAVAVDGPDSKMRVTRPAKRGGPGGVGAAAGGSPHLATALLSLPADDVARLRAFSAAAKSLSKTAYAPMLFVLSPRTGDA